MCRSASHRRHVTSQPRPAPTTRRTDPTMRAADADRERVIEALRAHAGTGRIGFDELGVRIEAASGARTLGDLQALLADLPRIVLESDRRAATARARLELREHVRAYVAVNVLLIAIWAFTGAGAPWFIWPLLGWGIAVVAQALSVHGAARARPRAPLRA
jgi:Domain of unknown function (DUF1707)/2TM domain